mgnify:CR=1 FL=1
MVHRYDLQVYRQTVEITDDDLLNLVEQRFKDFTTKYRIKKGTVEVYKRPSCEIVFQWVEDKDQSDEHYQKVKKVHSLIKDLGDMLKELT